MADEQAVQDLQINAPEQWESNQVITAARLNEMITFTDNIKNQLNSYLKVNDIGEKLEELGYRKATSTATNASIETISQAEAKTTLDNRITTVQYNESTNTFESNETGNNFIAGVTSLIQSLNKILDKIADVEEKIDGYENKYQNSINTFPYYRIGDILISATNRGKAKSAWPISNSDKRCICNTLTDLENERYWIPFGEGRVLLGAGTNDGRTFPLTENNQEVFTGGEYEHELIYEEIPDHTHEITTTTPKYKIGTSSQKKFITAITVNSKTKIPNATNGIGHNNMQPYIVVYFYKRVNAADYQSKYGLDSNFKISSNVQE